MKDQPLHHFQGLDRTRAYIDRRVSEGKTKREAIRCLKRYVARELYELIMQATSSTGRPSTT